MANLYTGYVESNKEYVDLQEATGVTFTNGNSYQIQFQNKGYIRAGEIGEGFLINFLEPFDLNYKGDDIYVCSETKLKINISE